MDKGIRQVTNFSDLTFNKTASVKMINAIANKTVIITSSWLVDNVKRLVPKLSLFFIFYYRDKHAAMLSLSTLHSNRSPSDIAQSTKHIV